MHQCRKRSRQRQHFLVRFASGSQWPGLSQSRRLEFDVHQPLFGALDDGTQRAGCIATKSRVGLHPMVSVHFSVHVDLPWATTQPTHCQQCGGHDRSCCEGSIASDCQHLTTSPIGSWPYFAAGETRARRNVQRQG